MASSDPNKKPKPGQWPPVPESKPMPPTSWAKKTGFRPKFSGETNASDSGPVGSVPKSRGSDSAVDLELGRSRPLPTANGPVAVPAVPPAAVPATGGEKEVPVKRRRDSDGGSGGAAKGPTPVANGNGPGHAVEGGSRRGQGRNEEGVEAVPHIVEDDGFVGRKSHMK